MKNAFDGITTNLHAAEESISDLEDISIETLKTGKQTQQRLKKKKQNNNQELWGQLQKL